MKLSRLMKSVLICVVMATVAACGPGTYLDAQHTKRLDACPSGTAAHPRLCGYAAVLLALQERKWVINSADKETGTIRATACIRQTTKDCATIVAVVDPTGNVSIHNPNDVRMERDMVGWVERWMIGLQKTYDQYRCYTEEYLMQEMSKYRW